MTADLSRVVAIVPVRSLSGAKSRLGEPLDPEERSDLVVAMLRRTVRAGLAARLVARVIVVSQDPEVVRRAGELGADGVLQRGNGLNEALTEGRAVAKDATALLVLPADLPAVSADAIDALVEAAGRSGAAATGRPLVALVPDHHGSGTNALLASPPDAIAFRFGEGSRRSHEAEARAAGATYVEVEGPLTFDVDTPDDLLEADRRGLGQEVGR
jgi:2-phospho-L-lactate/phosphoenolpyruvate guanylyltransferase